MMNLDLSVGIPIVQQFQKLMKFFDSAISLNIDFPKTIGFTTSISVLIDSIFWLEGSSS